MVLDIMADLMVLNQEHQEDLVVEDVVLIMVVVVEVLLEPQILAAAEEAEVLPLAVEVVLHFRVALES